MDDLEKARRVDDAMHRLVTDTAGDRVTVLGDAIATISAAASFVNSATTKSKALLFDILTGKDDQ